MDWLQKWIENTNIRRYEQPPTDVHKRSQNAVRKLVLWTACHIRLVPLYAATHAKHYATNPASSTIISLISPGSFLHVSLWASQRVRIRSPLDTLLFTHKLALFIMADKAKANASSSGKKASPKKSPATISPMKTSPLTNKYSYSSSSKNTGDLRFISLT